MWRRTTILLTLGKYSGPSYGRYANTDLAWEVGEKINIGMDMTLFRSLNLTLAHVRLPKLHCPH